LILKLNLFATYNYNYYNYIYNHNNYNNNIIITVIIIMIKMGAVPTCTITSPDAITYTVLTNFMYEIWKCLWKAHTNAT
jgi:hypothetical protein